MRPDADAALTPSLSPYPRCFTLRSTNKLALKVFDFATHLKGDRMLLIDSDVLFFSEPVELIRRIECPGYHLNTFNEDVDTAYTVDLEDTEQILGFKVLPRINSGLALIHRQSLDWATIEAFLALPGIIGHFWRIEQTLFALCSSKFGVEHLPKEYSVHLDGAADGKPCRHYVGAVRHQMYREGIRKLARGGFLKAINDPAVWRS
jgi:hypothetical protein